MPRPRTGTFEIAELVDRRVFRGRLRLADGTKSDRFDLPVDMNERQARAYLGGLQAEEDSSHAVCNAKQERARELAAARKEPHERETCDAWFLFKRRNGLHASPHRERRFRGIVNGRFAPS